MRGVCLAIGTLVGFGLASSPAVGVEDQSGEEEICALQISRPERRLLGEGSRTEQGARIPLNVLPFSPDADTPTSPAMTVDVSPVTSSGQVLPQQRVLFDTGSAGLALCNTSFSDVLGDLLKPGFVPCKSYGGPGNWVSGYWGKVYEGGLQIGGVLTHGANYAVMQQQIGMPCNVHGFMGIFGAALKPDYFLWETTATLSKPLWKAGEVDSCETSIPGVTGKTTLMPPLEHMGRELAGGDVRRLGIYWSGHMGNSVGTVYMNDDAVADNPHYDARSALRARLKQGLNGEYNIFIKSMKAGGVTFTGFPCTAKDLRQYCILDTGSSATVLPKAVVDAAGGSGSLEVELEGPGSQDPSVRLVFDIPEMSRIMDTPLDGPPLPINQSFVMLGFPTWAFYYTVFSSDGVAEFVPHATAGTKVCCFSGTGCGDASRSCSSPDEWCSTSRERCMGDCGGHFFCSAGP